MSGSISAGGRVARANRRLWRHHPYTDLQQSLAADYDSGYANWDNLLQITPTGAPGLCVNIGAKNQFSTTCAGGTTFTHDAAGNLAFDGSLSATGVYPERSRGDAENRIVSTNASLMYTYDGNGRRVNNSNGKLYSYRSGSDALAESDLAGAVQRAFILCNGKSIARRTSRGSEIK